MPGLMKGKRGLIMGVANDHSIAWGIAKALKSWRQTRLLVSGRSPSETRESRWPTPRFVVSDPCDVEDIASVDAVFDKIRSEWGTMDFLVHAVAFSDKTE